MKRYVQHISGQGEKWEVIEDYAQHYWIVRSKVSTAAYQLPRSEYIHCDPPEEWEDVTVNFEGLSGAKTIHLNHNERFLYIDCVQYIDCIHNGPAFIIQRRKS